jgi:CBS domain-containing protein
MKIGELMTRDVITVTPGTSLKVVATLLVERRISGVPVCDGDGRVLGVISEADIIWKTQGYRPERSRFLRWVVDKTGGDFVRLDARNAGDAMTTPALTVGPDADVTSAARLMVERRVNRLPVVEDGRLVGIVTRADLVRAFNRADAEIEAEIRDRVLLETMWLDPHKVEVKVDDGDVTLTGEFEDTEVVEAFVRRIPGVVSVSCR